MKTIGIIGGMSWESTTLYYQIINREVARRLGGLHSASMNMVSLDFADIVQRQRAGDWDGMTEILIASARRLEAAGAQCLLIATNTMHRVAAAVQQAVQVPLLHIADVTATAVKARQLATVGLLGTLYTMEQPFYVEHMAARGVACVVPDSRGRAEVHRIIFEELCRGEIRPESRRTLLEICAELGERGAAGIVLGCTEIPLILGDDDIDLPIFDTTRLHALAAVDFALEDESMATA